MQFSASDVKEKTPQAQGGQFLDDRESLVALVNSMSRAEKETYQSFGALMLEAAFPNRRMVVYTLRNGRPSDIEILTFGDLEMARIGGATVHVADTKGEFEIGMVPTRYRSRDLFLHIPQNFTYKWKGKRNSEGKVQFVPHYAVLVKSRSKEIHQVEGHTYCATFNKFRERWPDLDLRY
jgi:hypothetical protein